MLATEPFLISSGDRMLNCMPRTRELFILVLLSGIPYSMNRIFRSFSILIGLAFDDRPQTFGNMV